MAPEFPTKIARVGAVLTLLGSLIWVQWPIDLTRFNATGIIIFIGSLMAWASIEAAEYINGDNSNRNELIEDVSKINYLMSIINRNQFYILSKKQIQTYMEDDDYDGLLKLINFHEYDIFPFHNKKIQLSYEKFYEEARDFYSEFYDLYGSVGDGRTTWRPRGGGLGDGWVDDERFAEVMSQKAKLDRKATKIAGLWEELIKIARQELKRASKPVDRYEI